RNASTASAPSPSRAPWPAAAAAARCPGATADSSRTPVPPRSSARWSPTTCSACPCTAWPTAARTPRTSTSSPGRPTVPAWAPATRWSWGSSSTPVTGPRPAGWPATTPPRISPTRCTAPGCASSPTAPPAGRAGPLTTPSTSSATAPRTPSSGPATANSPCGPPPPGNPRPQQRPTLRNCAGWCAACGGWARSDAPDRAASPGAGGRPSGHGHEGEVGQAHDVAVAPQPHGAVPVHAVAGLLRQGVTGVRGEPFLGVGLVGGLEVLPFAAARGLGPDRPEARRDGQVDETGGTVELRRVRPGPHGRQLAGGGRSLPEPFAEHHTAARGDQAPEGVERGGEVLRRPGVAEGVAGAETEDDVGGAAGGADGGLLHERHASGPPAGLGGGPPPGQGLPDDADPHPGRLRSRVEEAEDELAPAAADVQHGPRSGRPGPGTQPVDHPGGPLLGQGAVEGEPGQAGRPAGVVHGPNSREGPAAGDTGFPRGARPAPGPVRPRCR